MTRFDKRWLIAGILLLTVFAAAVIINGNHEINDTSKFINAIIIENDDQNINWTKYKTTNVQLSETVEITNPGTYHLTGSLDEGLIEINLDKTEPVRLILDNAVVKNSTGPAILCHEADQLVIELIGENYLEDGQIYNNNYSEDIKGALYSAADLAVEGSGTLNIKSNYGDGIISKDDLKFKSGIYNISAKDDAVRGKDSVYIIDGSFDLESGADGIKSTNEFDSGKGFVLIENGSFNIESGAKGVKAINSVLIRGGIFSLKTYDDAIHSDHYVGISDGKIEINSGDDGIHANEELIIDNGDIIASKSHEGLEAQVVTINGGKISLTTTDDGINAGGGADTSANAGPFNQDLDCILSINGGELYINASGDGIDSNGYLSFNGGTVIVDGPTNNGNGALDAGAGIKMNGGKVIALGSSGMAESLGQTSTVYSVNVFFTTVQPKDTKIEIRGPSDESLMSHTSAKTFSHMAAGTSGFEFGKTYKIYINDELYQEFTILDTVTTIGSSNTTRNNFVPRR